VAGRTVRSCVGLDRRANISLRRSSEFRVLGMPWGERSELRPLGSPAFAKTLVGRQPVWIF
jgi:hypothetical protein